MNDKNILIVEDEILIAQLIRESVTQFGFQADVVKSGPEALEYVQTNQVDLILMDVMLGGPLNGIDTVVEIQKQSLEIPVVYATGAMIEKDAPELTATNPAGVVKKPIHIGQLIQTIKEILD